MSLSNRNNSKSINSNFIKIDKNSGDSQSDIDRNASNVLFIITASIYNI